MAITFNQGDHPIPHPRRYSLVVSLIMGTMCLTNVLMDGSSGLNTLYASTLDRMGISRGSLRPSKVPFYEIVLGKEAVPLERIWLNVTFGQPDNFPSVYHALLGRPSLAMFMAVPNYTYQKLVDGS
jgi:hypothetical protein